MTQNLGSVTEEKLRNHGNFHTPLNHFKFYAPVSVFGLGRRGETYIVDFNDPTLRLNLSIQAQPSCYKNLELLDLDGNYRVQLVVNWKTSRQTSSFFPTDFAKIQKVNAKKWQNLNQILVREAPVRILFGCSLRKGDTKTRGLTDFSHAVSGLYVIVTIWSTFTVFSVRYLSLSLSLSLSLLCVYVCMRVCVCVCVCVCLCNTYFTLKTEFGLNMSFWGIDFDVLWLKFCSQTVSIAKHIHWRWPWCFKKVSFYEHQYAKGNKVYLHRILLRKFANLADSK